MNRTIHQISFVIFLHFASLPVLNGQQNNQVQSHDSVILFSDRTLYIAGEKISFSAFLLSETDTNQSEQSRILYCELITQRGNKISSDKFLIKDNCTSGYLSIPNDIITGIYYLRAYTRYMRNWGPSCYHYSLIKIVNANRSDVQALETDTFPSGSNSFITPPEISADSFQISSNKSQYSARENVTISIECREAGHSSWKELSLSVVPEYSVSGGIMGNPETQRPEQRSFFYPETSGLSITGKITDNITGKPLPDTRVNLSIIGRGKDFMAIRSDTAGRFFFSLPEYMGHRDLFLSAEKTGISDPKILVDNDFCTIPVHIPTNGFTLTGEESKTALNMAVNVQIGSHFNIDSIPEEVNNQHEDRAFYGNPDDILYIDNYVQLPTLEEYFNELPTLVKVRKRQGEKYFRVLGNQAGLTYFDPLILVDLVAVNDPAVVLEIPPVKISRIEIVNTLYEKGDQTYGGIINIITKLGDFAGIDLPASGIFVNYGFLSDTSHYKGICLPPSHFPDTRNTLFWEPKLGLDKYNSAKATFKTSDNPGRYLIILNGINSKGESFRQISAFEVRKPQIQ